MEKIKNAIQNGQTYLGIEFGSTRIKAVLIDETHKSIATGSHTWENKLEKGVWTYSLDDVWEGVRDCYADLTSDIKEKYGTQLEAVSALGISGMMHGYLAFDKEGQLLVPFRTWRNTTTGEAAEKLTQLFEFNVPQRWSIAHLYQSILNDEAHVPEISYITTLAGYVYWKLTGEKKLGTGDASGMFPIDNESKRYDEDMLNKFDVQISDKNLPWKLKDILPEVKSAGDKAGLLTQEGAKLLDAAGKLKAGIEMCPAEGDAGTGMVATNAVGKRTGNVSAGTSIFAMVVLEKALSKVYPEIDMVTTPSGEAVAMVHSNNCLGDVDAWVNLLGEAANLMGAEFDTNTLYERLYASALESAADCDGLLSYNYISGEHLTGFEEGRPLFVRTSDAPLNLGAFMRTHLYSACASLKVGMKILMDKEKATLDSITGHGGFFKQAYAGQRIMSAVMDASVTVMSTAGEGGPWGMAVLAAYMKTKQGESLAEYLAKEVFAGSESSTVAPNAADVAGFAKFMERYEAGLGIERAAVEHI